MTSVSRRRFLTVSSSLTASFLGLRRFCDAGDSDARANDYINKYGPLVVDPTRTMSLPAGFKYQVISRVGDSLDDGLLLPGLPDGMATFAGPGGETILIRNHELTPPQGNAFGKKNELLKNLDRDQLYDYGGGQTPGGGGTSTVIFDTKTQSIKRQFMSLLGTHRNCAGGPTPWNSWISCEETVVRSGRHEDGYLCEKDHGYPFEVPATTDIAIAPPRPLTAMGRFNHEALAVDAASGVVYQTEDRDDGLFYRFLPTEPGNLAGGGRLQALQIADQPSADTRNWPGAKQPIEVGLKINVRWMDLEEINSPEDNLRHRGHKAGAARFARGEGIWAAEGEIYFACTSGGEQKAGQVWRYIPSSKEGTKAEGKHPGTLELFIQPNNTGLLKNVDNLTIAPSGDLILCEDHKTHCRLIGVTPQGDLYLLGQHRRYSELAGACFSPDGSTLFVNIQKSGQTLAITGAWK